MIRPPPYFELIRQRAEKRWQQLEGDPELAGPWHQLFKQVQSPRHVLSELLQNADDAGATEASIDLADGAFLFSHNGEDFTEEHFTSLCRFGYSNKRALHTIGFRGIGFKSTFSLGDTVELYIDHPEGVTLDLCERVTHALPELREDHALTVSSPGLERPLGKPEHFSRFIGRSARVRTTEPQNGRKTFTGEIVGASADEVTIATQDGVVAIPFQAIHRSNLVES